MNAKKKLSMLVMTSAMVGLVGMSSPAVLAASEEPIEKEFTIASGGTEVADGFEIDVSKPNIPIEETNEPEKPTEEPETKEPEAKAKPVIVSQSTKATPPTQARATVTSSVGTDNKPYPVREKIETETSSECVSSGQLKERPKADAREFITFKTKSGKQFYLIIDRDEQTNNAMLVTEVSEQDLLNMVESDEAKGKQPEIEPVVEEVEKEEPVQEETETKQGIPSWAMLGGIMLVVGGAGYYFKVVKGKKDDFSEFEEDESTDDDYVVEESNDSVEESSKEDLL